MASAMFGAPVSTSQVIGMALMGAGSAERVNKVRWQVGKDMLMTWALTIPATMGIAALVYWVSAGVGQVDWLINQLINWLVSG